MGRSFCNPKATARRPKGIIFLFVRLDYPDEFRGRSFVLWIEHEPLAVDHLAVLRDRRVDAGATLGVEKLSWRSGSEPGQN